MNEEFYTGIENIVLGQLMFDRLAYDEVIGLLRDDLFFVPTNKTIFIAISMVYKEHKDIDLASVVEMLSKQQQLSNVGGPVAIAKLTNYAYSSADIEINVRRLIERFLKYSIIKQCDLIKVKALSVSTEANAVIQEFQNRAINIDEGFEMKQPKKIGGLIKQKIKDASSDKPQTIFIPTGIKKLDKAIKGVIPGTVTIIAARPSHGKSILSLNIAINMAKAGVPCGIFVLEMKDSDLASRAIAAETGVSSSKIDSGSKKIKSEEWTGLYKCADDFENTPIWIDDTAMISIPELRAKARRLVNKHKIKVLFVDYLQQMKGDPKYDRDRTRQIGDLSNQLLAIAKDLDIAIIPLSQLNRSVDSRPKEQQIPKLSDLRESGEIEQDAHTVIFIANPKMIGLNMYEGQNVEDKAIISVAKCRHGSLSEFLISKSKDQMKWGTDNEIDCPVPDYNPQNSDELPF